MCRCKVCDKDKHPSEYYKNSKGEPRGWVCGDCERTKEKERRGKPRQERARRRTPVLTEAELQELRRVHKVGPDDIGRRPQVWTNRKGSTQMPAWLKEWFNNAIMK